MPAVSSESQICQAIWKASVSYIKESLNRCGELRRMSTPLCLRLLLERNPVVKGKKKERQNS